jgi:hypothetical protein
VGLLFIQSILCLKGHFRKIKVGLRVFTGKSREKERNLTNFTQLHNTNFDVKTKLMAL